MNIGFDSDSQALPNESNFDSDIDARMMANQEISNYQETISELKKQNLILKAQFDQAVTVAKKIDGVHEENFKLSNQVRSLQLENENLQCRLQILVHNNEELESQLSNFKSTFAQQVLQANSDKEIEVSKTKKLCNGKIDTLLIRVNKSEELKEQSLVEVKMLKSKIERMLQSANDYFKLKFEEIDNFIDFLNQTACTKQTNTDTEPVPQLEPVKPFKNKNEKQKIKTLKSQVKKLALEINGLHDQLSQTESEHSKEVKKYQNEIQKLKEDLEMVQTENSETIRLLKSKNQHMKEQFVKLRKEAVDIQTQLLSKPPSSPKPEVKETVSHSKQNSKENDQLFKEQIKILTDENEKLNGQIKEMKAKMNQLNEEKSELLSKLKEANNSNVNLQMKIDQNEIERQASEAVKKETAEELKNLRERLKMKEDKKPKQETIEKLKDEINRLESVTKSQENELRELNLKIEQNTLERSSNHTKYLTLQNENDELKAKILALNDELNELSDRLAMKPELKPEDVMPDAAFRCKEFDTSLSQKVEQVAFNQYLSPQSKLSKIYGLIVVHYNGLLKESDDKVKHMIEHLEAVKKQLNSFLVDLSIGMSFNALSFDDFLIQGGQKIIDRAVEAVKNVDDLRRKNTQLFSIVSQISEEFGLPFGKDVYSQISCLSKNITSHFTNSRQTELKYADLKKRNKVSRRSFLTKIQNLEQSLCEVTKKCQESQCENENLSKVNQDLKKEVHLSKLEIISLKESMKQSEESLRDEHQSIIDDMTKRFLSEKVQLNGQIEKIKNERKKAKMALSDTESSCDRMKVLIDKHHEEIKKQEEELESFKKAKEEEINHLNEKFTNEKKELTKTFENAINEIKTQCEKQRSEFSELSQKLESKTVKYQKSLDALSQLKREKQKLEKEVRTLEDQINLEKVISDASLKNQIMSVESKCAQQIHEANSKVESEKRRIISFAVDEFRSFSNSSKSLDERSFRSLLTKIRTELDKYSKSDLNIRRMTGAQPYQSTEEAVAKLLE